MVFSEKVKKELDKRYKECDNNEHKMVIDNRCTYCYRRESYAPSELLQKEIDQVFKERSKLHSMDIPCDAPIWRGKRERNIVFQKSLDYIHGLGEIARQIYPNKFA